MPQNRFYIENNLENNLSITIDGQEHHHLKNVMRSKVSDEIELVNGKGYLAIARIEQIDAKFTKVLIIKSLKKSQKKKVSLAIALTKMTKLELAIEKCTELGAYEFLLFDSINSEKKGLSSNQRQRLEMVTISALKQCGRLYLPKISYFETIDKLLKNIPSKLLVCDFDETAKPICDFSNLSDVSVLIGPEKGFHITEKTAFKKIEADMVSLHENILRAETAAIAATAYLTSI